ncbi:MAG: TRAP transporter large permease subunit [Verrucomicrobiota bacterium]
MSELPAGIPEGKGPEEAALSGWRGALRHTENLALTFCLALLVLLPLLEIVLRAFRTGIPSGSEIIKHFTLFIGMLGGAVAARQNRLLALSTLSNLLPESFRKTAQVFSAAFATAITAILAGASLIFVNAERQGGAVLGYGIPLWIVQLILPLGFGLIALRLIWHASAVWKGRIATALLAGGIVALGLWSPIEPGKMIVPALVALAVATLFGAPVFTVLGGAALILLWGNEQVVAAVPARHYSLVTNEALPAIPLFTLAGYFLAEGGAAKRLVRLFQAWFGAIRGGPAIVTVCVCAFFTSFTGASGVTILALGGLLMPVLLAARYSERNSLGLLTSAGSLGLLFPPCLPLILYAIIAGTVVSNMDLSAVSQARVAAMAPATSASTNEFALDPTFEATQQIRDELANISIEKMFLGGIGPGILLLLLTAWWGVSRGQKEKTARPAFDWREARQSLWAAKWELLLPVVALYALFSGRATALEAAAVTALYAFIIETFVHRDLRLFKDVPRVMTECGLLVGGVLLILGVAMGFTHFLIMEEIPTRGVEWATRSIQSAALFLLMLNLFLLVVGCLMDIYSAIVVVVPIIVPMGIAFGIDPIHLGIIFLANLELGYLTPPVGMNLFLSSYRFGKPMGEVIKSVLPMLVVLVIGVLLITYVPALTTFLPRLIK